MIGIAARVEGGAALAQKLRSLSGAVTQRVLLDALEAAAVPIAESAANLAPHGDPRAPNLYQSIEIQRLRSADPLEAAVAIGPTKDVFYGFFLEFGTRKMPARPFMRRAFDAMGEEALSRMHVSVWAALQDKMR